MVRYSSIALVGALTLASFLLPPAAAGHSTKEWEARTIYQVVTDRFARTDGSTSPCNDLSTYCGGTFKGLMSKLDYIQGMGFDAIWVSPVVANTQNGYHGYWASDLYAINSNFGTSDDFKGLIAAMHSRGMWIMLDVVGNHMGGSINDIGGFNPFNSSEDYHNCDSCPSGCSINDYNDQKQVQLCRLAGLPDLNQSNYYVASTLQSWLKFMVETYNLDGIRVDTCPEVNKPFWGKFQAAAGTYAVGEVFNGDLAYVKGFQAASVGQPGLTGILSYPMYYTVRSVFQQKQSMNQLQGQLKAYQASLANPSAMGSFIDNHDNPRFLSTQGDRALYKSALAFNVYSTGIPIVYYGSEQYFSGGADPNCREALWTSGYSTSSDGYTFLSTLLTFRKKAAVAAQPQVQRYSDDSFYAFTRGDTLVCLTNAGSNSGATQRSISYHPYAAGTKICNVFYPTTDCIVVNGPINVYLSNGEVKVYSPLLAAQ